MAKESDRPVQRQRWRLLAQLTAAAEIPMAMLSVVWLVLLIIELAIGLSSVLEVVSYIIWGMFVSQFLLEFAIAPAKAIYLKRNWITLLALVLPAFRLLRFVRVFRFIRLAAAARSLSLIRVLLSLNRGLTTVRRLMARRGFGYVLALTIVVYFVGSAGMVAFEGISRAGNASQGFSSYGHALWWTAMIIATLGTDYWPKTGEGRLLCSVLAIYGFSVFGYITALLATYFIGTDRKRNFEQPSAPEIRALTSEVETLRRLITKEGHPQSQ